MVSSEDAETKASSQLPSKPAPSNGHVTFPNNFKVLEALKSGLTFGSFDANPGLGMNYSIANGCDNSSMHATELSHAAGETAKEPSYRLVNIILCFFPITCLKTFLLQKKLCMHDSFMYCSNMDISMVWL